MAKKRVIPKAVREATGAAKLTPAKRAAFKAEQKRIAAKKAKKKALGKRVQKQRDR